MDDLDEPCLARSSDVTQYLTSLEATFSKQETIMTLLPKSIHLSTSLT